MTLFQDDVIKLLAAILIGGLVGMEREFRDKAAGFRTIILICVGATLFTIFSVKLAGDNDPTRIAANIVTGVGFLGAGVLLRDAGRIVGLTTAATIWLAAALGMGIGGGEFLLTGVAAAAVLVVLWLFPFIEIWIDNRRETRRYEVVCAISHEKIGQLEALFHSCGLRMKSHMLVKRGDELIGAWEATGSPRNHNRLTQQLLVDAEVREFRF